MRCGSSRAKLERADILRRIRVALYAAAEVFRRLPAPAARVGCKGGGDPVTEADAAADEVLRRVLLRDGEGWLSEETPDDLSRLQKSRVWVVDPLDGTREFLSGISEWCVSVGFVEDGRAVAGGVLNPQTGEIFLGAQGAGMTYNGKPAGVSDRSSLEGALVLASRSEFGRGEWERFRGAPFIVRPTGSVAYRLALVAAGKADATWTLVPKNEWDVAAGVALVLGAGGCVYSSKGAPPTFNTRGSLLSWLVAHPPALFGSLDLYLGIASPPGVALPR